MKVAVLGAGPAGLYFAISMKRRNPAHEITVFERNRPDDTFGWGVVLSAETLDNLAANDAVSAAWIREYFAYWDDIAVVHKGVRTVSTGHGFCGIGRKRLLQLLQRRASDLGIELVFESEVADPRPFMASHDLVIGADGLNSHSRATFAEVFKPDIDVRKCKFVWLGTRQKFDDAFTFIFEETEHGWVWAHAYQFEPETATFIVECSEETWGKWGFGDMTREQSIAACERIFARHLGGQRLMSNAGHLRGSAWINFPRVLCERWSHKNLALLGDASASAHFSIGSGTKLALESAVALADYLHSEPSLEAAFDRYESARRTEVLRLQSAARNSLEWFEDVERYLDLDPVQFNYSLLTRSQRISHENLRLRDPAVAGRRRGVVPAPLRQHRQCAARADVRAVPAARPELEEPRRRLADGAVQGRRRLPDRLALRPLCRARQGRRRPGLHRDDLRQPRGPHHAGLHGLLCTRARDRLEAPGRFRACRDRDQDLRPDRPFGPQGLDAARLAAKRRAARHRQLAGDGRVRRALVAREPDAEADGPRRHGEGPRASSSPRPKWRHAAGSTCSRSMPRTAICCRRSSRRSPTVAPTNMAGPSRTACAIRWRSSMPCARSGRRRSRSRCASRPTTGSATRA